MKQFLADIESPSRLAHRLLEVGWHLVQTSRHAALGQMRAGSLTPPLTPPQMRALAVVREHPGASLSTLAENLGLQKPGASKIFEELVRQGRVSRGAVPGNRAKQALRITASGEAGLDAATAPAIAHVGGLLTSLTAEERETVARAIALLSPLVQPSGARAIASGSTAEIAESSVYERHAAQPRRTLRVDNPILAPLSLDGDRP